jgi:acyl carrier protein
MMFSSVSTSPADGRRAEKLERGGFAAALLEARYMSSETISVKHGQEEVFQNLVGILEDMTSDWESTYSGGIRPETRLIGDLGFESIDVVQLVVAIEEGYQSRSLPFEKLLMADGRYVDELVVSQIVDFLVANLNAK